MLSTQHQIAFFFIREGILVRKIFTMLKQFFFTKAPLSDCIFKKYSSPGKLDTEKLDLNTILCSCQVKLNTLTL